MALNPISNTKRTLPMSMQMTAGGGYTLPQHIFLPHPATQQLGSANGGRVMQPASTGMPDGFMLSTHASFSQRPYPQVQMPSHGIRVSTRKVSAGIND